MVSKGDDLSPIKSCDTFSRGRKKSHDKLKTLNLLFHKIMAAKPSRIDAEGKGLQVTIFTLYYKII